MRRHHLLATAAIAGALAWPALGGLAAGPQRKASPGASGAGQAERSLQEKGGIISVRKASKQGETSKDGKPQTQQSHGRLIRPLVPAGGSAAAAPEEGKFTLRPGDMLELECAVPRDTEDNLTCKVDDEGIIKLIPAGVRQLVPMAMVGGEPKPITGMTRAVALFQADKVGKTIIRLNVGSKQFEYKVSVERESTTARTK